MRSLTVKLTLAFLLVSLLGIALVAALVWGITAREFNRFIQDRGLNEYTSEVTHYYQSHGSWTGVDEYLRERGLVFAPGQQITVNNPPPPPFMLVDPNSSVVVAYGPYHTGTKLPTDQIQQKTAISVNNHIVGYVVQTGRLPRQNSLESRFLSRVNQALLLAALGVGFLAVLLGLLLARTITRPVRELTAATSALAQGNLTQPVAVRSQDELGQLTRSFNKMSTDLQRSNNLRRQMTADIAHDLRSPLAVITGYLEGLKDGVVKPTQPRFSAMYDEAIYLQRLVEDLRTLSLADAGELSMTIQPVQPAELIERLAAAYQHPAEQKQVSIRTDISPDLPVIRVDPERMLQALGNLIINALRYTQGSGEIVLSARQTGEAVAMEVQDNGAGIDPEVLPHVFERFYRGDSSRQDGGSGLGLAIAKSIVELHGGKIQATSNGSGAGSRFTILIPV